MELSWGGCDGGKRFEEIAEEAVDGGGRQEMSDRKQVGKMFLLMWNFYIFWEFSILRRT